MFATVWHDHHPPGSIGRLAIPPGGSRETTARTWFGLGMALPPNDALPLSYGVATAGTRTRDQRSRINPIASARADFANIRQTWDGIGSMRLAPQRRDSNPLHLLTDTVGPPAVIRDPPDMEAARTASLRSRTLTLVHRPGERAGCSRILPYTQRRTTHRGFFSSMLCPQEHDSTASVS